MFDLTAPLMTDCDYFNAGLCRSCVLLDQPYAAQLALKQQQFTKLLAAWPQVQLEQPHASAAQFFRNKAKMVVQGSAAAPILGIIGADGAVDLSDCPLYPPGFIGAFAKIKAFIQQLGLEPYDLSGQRGELKYVLLSQNPQQQWLLRWVLRSQHSLAAMRKHFPAWAANWPELRVCSVNIQPDHKAILEGEVEFVLSDEQMLQQRVNEVPLYLQAQSFFQTNHQVAAALYQTARDWTAHLVLPKVWDLFCGVGGFALHLAKAGREVTGIEISAAAIACASRSAAEMQVNINFQALDAAAFASAQQQAPDLLVVNPPRRGLGVDLCQSIEQLAPAYLLYSSCNPQSLQKDLQLLPQYQLQRAQLFDMFPHTSHAEVLTLLKRI